MGNGLTIATRAEVGCETWDSICDIAPAAWYWHTSAWLDYQVARGAADHSFAVMDGAEPIILCPLLVTGGEALVEGHPEAAAFGCKAGKERFRAELEAIATRNGLTRMAFRSHPFAESDIPDAAFWQTWSWQTQVIDLRPSVADLWRSVRKSYHALIHHAERTHEILVDDQGKSIDAFRQVHAHVAGRETRPRATWDMMRRWCETGNGLHVCASLGGVVVACAYFEVYKRCAYYGHAASLHKNLNHALIWRAMQELKARDVEQLEMGWLDYPGEESRAVFRTGFGGEARTIYAIERRWERC